MATLPPPNSVPSQPPSSQIDNNAPLSWEGEKMFNIYIYDYCFKRGYRKTARELMAEADIPVESTPPINARQGLLFEWWSVFWVLFQAKSGNGGTDDAILYTQHQQQQQQQQRAVRMQPAPIPPGQGHPPQPMRGPPGMMNGMSSNPAGQPQMPPGGSQMVFGAHGPQVNGTPGSHPPTPGGVSTQHPQHPGGPQQPGFNPMMQQRPMNGAHPQQPLLANGAPPQQQRPMGPNSNPNLPFQSPTMAAHSPSANPGMQQGPMSSQGQQLPGQQPPPMGNLGGPSPLLQPMGRGGMLPPNGVPPQGGMVMSGPQQQGGPMPSGTPNQGFQQLGAGRPPSRTNTPQMSGMPQQSPSMANRQVMGTIPDATVLNDFSRLQPQQVAALKQELGLGDNLTIQDKKRILQLNSQRGGRPPNAVAGPSSGTPAPNQQRGPQPQTQPPQQPQRGGKRNSTSPGEEHESLPRTESSPPDRKRPRRSPLEPNATIPKPMNTQMNYQQPGMQPQPGHPPPAQPPGGLQPQPAPTGLGPPAMMMNRQMGPQSGQMPPQMGMVNGHIPPPAMSMQGQQPTSPYNPMQGGMPGPMGHQQQLGGMMMANQPLGQTRIPLHQVHNAQGLMHPPNAGSPAGQDPSFNPGPSQGGPGGPQFNNQMMTGKPPPGGMAPGPRPGSNMMPPPPSPSNAGKDVQRKDIKPNVDSSPSGMGQPPNQSGGPSSQQGQGQPPQQPQTNPGPHPNQPPGTPGSQPPPQPPGPGTGAPPSASPNTMMSSSTNPMSGLNGPLNGLSDMNMFDPSFIDFDPNVLPDSTFDFARDFGQWFNPEELSSTAGLGDMK